MGRKTLRWSGNSGDDFPQAAKILQHRFVWSGIGHGSIADFQLPSEVLQ